jgi:hypothetical protein
LGRYLQPGAPPEKRWTAEELAMRATLPDEKLAEQVGRTPGAVRVKRGKLGIPSACDRWRRETRV